MAKRRRRKGGGFATVGMELIDGDVLTKAIEKMDVEVRENIAREAIDAGTKPILSAMVARTPVSAGSRDKQSQSSKGKWSGSRRLKDTIRAVVRDRKKFGLKTGSVGIVGPSYTDGGGHGNLFAKDHARTVYWGREAEGPRRVDQFVKEAADQSAGQASAAVMATAKAGIARAAKEVAKGG
jgi:hypothetical protein